MNTSSRELTDFSISAQFPATEPLMQRRTPRVLNRFAVIAILLDIVLLATLTGLRLRVFAFIHTDGAHFQGDVRNGFKWGSAAGDEGLFNLYDRVASDVDAGAKKTLDYPPLRLTAVWVWAQWAHRHYPDVTVWQDDYALTRPMLNANTIAEFSSSVLVFLLIRLWTLRMVRARLSVGIQPRPFCGVFSGLFGALLFWFNPAVIWDGHCWPQWDVWLIPFFLAAVLLASIDWWFTAGIFLMIGAALKGQLLLGAPVLILWPLFGLRMGAFFRVLSGLILTFAVIALPWMKLDSHAVVWCVTMILAALAISPRSLEMNDDRRWKFIALGAALLLAWPWGSHASILTRSLALAVLGVLFLARYVPRRLVPALYAAAIAVIVLLTIPLFNSDSNWFTVGFEYGTEKFDFMITGSGAWNIAKMQQVYFGLFERPDDPLTLPLIHQIVTYRTASIIVYSMCVLICSGGAAFHARRRRPDTRFLAAMVAPWLCFFMILTQMHGRYLIWAAGLSALLAGVSMGMACLGVLVSLIGWMGMVENQYLFAPQYDPDTLRNLGMIDPHVGWALLVIMAIYLYVAAASRKSWM